MGGHPKFDPATARSIVLGKYARLKTLGPGVRQALKQTIYDELIQDGQPELAELFMLYDAVAIGASHEMSDKPTINYNFNNAQIANANFGTQIGTITSSLDVVSKRGNEGADFATALKTLTEGVVNSHELSDQQKKKVLESLELLGQEAEMPADKRKMGILEAVIESVPKMLSSASALVNLWHTFGPQITSFFGF